MLEILDGSQLGAEDIVFLESYFDVVDVHDHEAKVFFENAQKTLNDIIYNTKDSRLIGEKIGEVLLRGMEKAMGKFETDRMIVLALTFVVGTVLMKYVTDMIASKIKI